MATKEVIASPNAPAAIGPYSQAIKANGFVFVSGTLGLHPRTGEMVGPTDIRAQTEQVLSNMKAVLEKADSSFEHVVKTTVLLKNMGDYKTVNEIYAKYFTTAPPARAAFAVAALPRDALVEIEAVALSKKGHAAAKRAEPLTVLQPRPSTAAGGAAAAARAGPPAGVCTPIAAHGGSFLITDAPSDDNLHVYIEEFKKHSVTALVRACEPTYGTGLLTAAGIAVHELPFRDGEPPPPEVEAAWLRLCEERFPRGRSSTSAPAQTVALHCVAGLGRSPVLVALFFIDRGMEPLAAVELVRKKRRGAINRKQLDYLCTRRPRSSCGGCAVA